MSRTPRRRAATSPDAAVSTGATAPARPTDASADEAAAPEEIATAPWYADGLQFTCTQCGRCCGGAPGYVWVSDEECGALAAELNMTPEAFIEKHTRTAPGGRRSLLEKPNRDCQFLARDRHGKALCLVYHARPVQCRTWPFWSSNLESAADWKSAARSCPGMNAGTHHALPVIQAALTANGSLPL